MSVQVRWFTDPACSWSWGAGSRLFVSAHGRAFDSPHPFRGHFRLPACPVVCDET